MIAANAIGQLVNTATVTPPAGAVDGDTANNSATSTVTLTPSADVQVTKSGPATAVAGTNVVYTITVTNAGPADATGVTLTDPTPPGLTFVSNTGDCTTAFPCNLGTLPPAATRTITATFAIPSGYTTPDPIANTAAVSSTTPDAAAGNNSATATTSLGAAVTDLHITKTNGVNGVVAGLPTTYTITITNPLGPSDAIGATITDALPDDADRGHVDVHGYGRRCVPDVGQRRHQYARDRAGGRDASSSSPPARSIRRLPASS